MTRFLTRLYEAQFVKTSWTSDTNSPTVWQSCFCSLSATLPSHIGVSITEEQSDNCGSKNRTDRMNRRPNSDTDNQEHYSKDKDSRRGLGHQQMFVPHQRCTDAGGDTDTPVDVRREEERRQCETGIVTPRQKESHSVLTSMCCEICRDKAASPVSSSR